MRHLTVTPTTNRPTAAACPECGDNRQRLLTASYGLWFVPCVTCAGAGR